MVEQVQEVEQENLGPYRGAYRADVYKDDVPEVSEEATLEEDTTFMQDETISVEAEEKTEVKTEEHDYKKRYDDLKKHYDAKLHEWKEEKDALVSQNSQPTISEDDIESFKESYPDVYNVVEALSTRGAAKEIEELRAEVTRLNQQEEKLKAKSAYQELLALHNDFPEVKKSNEFREWIKLQPPSIADGILKNSTDVKWASRVLDLYKADIGKSKRGRPRKQGNAAAAEAVTKTSSVNIATNANANKKVWTTSEIRRLKPNEFDKYEKELDQARLEGRIVNG
tara:strand:- start:94 stop:939 length:846 start_codon:yes stop_codon:yes gene_type:complete